jgi:hypothetical protein
MCEEHLKRSNNRIVQLLTERLAQGLCRQCGKHERLFGDSAFCVMCRAKNFRDGSIPIKMRKVIRQFWRMDSIAIRRELAESILPRLNDRESQIFTLRHGLHDAHDRTLEAIGKELDLTRERIRQIEERALFRLEDEGVDVSVLRPPFSAVQRPPAQSSRRKSGERASKRKTAWKLTKDALKSGTLVRKPCEVCGDEESQGHHVNYDQPLNVKWLCRAHHMKAHGKKLRTVKPVRKTQKRAKWIGNLPPANNDLYPASYLRRVITAGNPKLKQVVRGSRISGAVLLRVLRGEKVTPRILTRAFAYADKLQRERKEQVSKEAA